MTYSKERFNALAAPQGAGQVIAWCVRQFQTIARAMPWAPHADTRDFITTAEGADVTPQFQAAATAVGTGTLFISPRVYRFFSNITIPAACLLEIANGALLQPQPGVVVKINGPVRAGHWGWMDRTGGGDFDYSDNLYISSFLVRWFGVTGDGVTNDAPAMNWMSNILPDGAEAVFTRNLRVRLGDGTGGVLYDNTATYTPGQRVGYNGVTYQCVLTSTGNPPTSLAGVLDSTHWSVVAASTVTKGMWIAALFRNDITYRAKGYPATAYFGFKRPTLVWAGPPGGTMVGNYNSGNTRIQGLFLDAQTAYVGIDQDQFNIGTTASSTAITVNASNTGGTGNGAPFLNQIPTGTRIRLSNAGPSAGPLDTTLTAASDGTHGTIAVAASTTLSNNAMAVGQSAPAPSNNISTECWYKHNKILGGTGVAQFVGIQNSITSLANCEFNRYIENYITGNAQFTQMYQIPQNGNGFARANFNGNPTFSFAAPGGSMTKGSNQFSGFSVDTFTASMNGARIQIAGAGVAMWDATVTYAIGDQVITGGTVYQAIAATTGNQPPNATFWSVTSRIAYPGPNMTRGAIDGYMKYVTARHVDVFSDPALTVALNAQANVSLAAQGYEPHFYVGQSLGIGIWNGPSFNAHKQVLKRNQLNFLNVGFRCDAGSFELENNAMTDNEIDHVVLNSQAMASSIKGDVSENSRQWLRTQSLEPLEIFSARLGAGYCAPGQGFLQVLNNAIGPLLLKGSHVEGVPSPDNAHWNLSQAAGQPVRDEGNNYSDATTLAHIGWSSLPESCVVKMESSHCVNTPGLLPFEKLYLSSNAVFNSFPQRYLNGQVFLYGRDSQVPDGLFDVGSWSTWFRTGNGRHNLMVRAHHFDGTQLNHAMPVWGDFSLVDGATVAVDFSQGNYARLSAGGSRTISFPTSETTQPYFIEIINNTAGAITTTWNGGYRFAVGQWTDPAAGKRKFVLFMAHNDDGLLWPLFISPDLS